MSGKQKQGKHLTEDKNKKATASKRRGSRRAGDDEPTSSRYRHGGSPDVVGGDNSRSAVKKGGRRGLNTWNSKGTSRSKRDIPMNAYDEVQGSGMEEARPSTSSLGAVAIPEMMFYENKADQEALGQLAELPQVYRLGGGQSIPSDLEAFYEAMNIHEGAKFVDTHCHIDFIFKNQKFRHSWQRFKESVIPSTMPPTYESCIADFCDPRTYVEDGGLWEILRKNEDIYTAFGCHPHSASLYMD